MVTVIVTYVLMLYVRLIKGILTGIEIFDVRKYVQTRK